MTNIDDKYKHKPRVAVGLILFDSKNNEVLLLKRNKKDGLFDYWGPICGKLDYLEGIEDGLIREASEEIGINIEPEKLKFVEFSERIKDYPHYVVLWHLYHIDKDQIEIKINEEFSDFSWFPLGDLPSQLEMSMKKIIEKL